jgi:dipeptidyl aminopeptidase/acylaminoacyl peptidase
LVLDGTPEIPGALVARLTPWLEARSAVLYDLEDDGGGMLVGTRFAETYQVHHVAQRGGARRQLTFQQEPAESASFVPGGEAFLYTADEGGNEQDRVFRFDLATGVARAITPEGKTDGYVWSNGRDRIAFNVNARNGADMDVWVTTPDAAPDEAELVAAIDGYGYPLDWRPDDRAMLIGRYVSITESHVSLLDLETGVVSPISTADAPAYYGTALFGPDGESIYVVSDRGGDFRRLWRRDADGSWSVVTPDIDWDIEGLTANSDRSMIAFAANEGGLSRMYVLDTATGVRASIAVPDGIIYGMQFARRAPVIGYTLNSATTTGDVFQYDLTSGETTRWTESEMGGLDTSRLRSPTLVSYESFDGLEVPAFYYEPEGDGPWPVVVSIHGGPETQARPYFSSLTQFLVTEMNVAVLVPNVRGSSGYGREYVLMDNGFRREDSVRDIGSLLDWIAEQPELDEGRVAVIGGSYGGYMVLASLMHYSDRLAAGVDVVGISNFVTFLENTSEYRRDLRRAEYGDERDPEMREFLLSISPTENVERIRAPLFVAQGANDPRVPASEAEQIVNAVRRSGRDVWYMLAMNEGHGFARRENRDVYLQLVIIFFEEHLF